MLVFVVLCVSWTRTFCDGRKFGCGITVVGPFPSLGDSLFWVCFKLETIFLEHRPFQNIFH